MYKNSKDFCNLKKYILMLRNIFIILFYTLSGKKKLVEESLTSKLTAIYDIITIRTSVIIK